MVIAVHGFSVVRPSPSKHETQKTLIKTKLGGQQHYYAVSRPYISSARRSMKGTQNFTEFWLLAVVGEAFL